MLKPPDTASISRFKKGILLLPKQSRQSSEDKIYESPLVSSVNPIGPCDGPLTNIPLMGS